MKTLLLSAGAGLLTLCLVGCPAPVNSDAGQDAGGNGADGGDASAPGDVVSTGDVQDVLLPIDAMVPDRAPGIRAPRTAACDPLDTLRCTLPWPSNTFARLDPTTETGIRVAVEPSSLLVADSPDSINRADGFSRISPLLVGFPAILDPASFGDGTTASVMLVVAQPGAHFGEKVPLRVTQVVRVSSTRPETLLVVYPRVPLLPATDYVGVVTTALHTMDGTVLTPTEAVEVALGTRPPVTLDEAELRAYHAPTRALLTQLAIPSAQVLRVWDFTTRSLNDPLADLQLMRAAAQAAVAAGTTHAVIDTAVLGDGTNSAAIVEGRLTGLPSFLTTDYHVVRNSAGAPTANGTHDAPFRIVIPAGTGSYRAVMFGHGLGGNVSDNSFDAEISSYGAAKIGIEFAGLTDTTVLDTFSGFLAMMDGTDIAAARLKQSVADAMAIQRALNSDLGTLLAAPMLATLANPASGRHPDMTLPVWAGGSLGGTMGFVYAHLEDSIAAAVLNVPGAAWSHYLANSVLYQPIATTLRTRYHTELDVAIYVAVAQLNWDGVDGANWNDATSRHPPLLLQESIGDPVLPNIGTEIVATTTHATQIGTVLQPILDLPQAAMIQNGRGLTQYHVDATGAYDVHGFAARDTPAGRAARQQISSFVLSVWAGSPAITVPQGCLDNTPSGSCDFRTMP